MRKAFIYFHSFIYLFFVSEEGTESARLLLLILQCKFAFIFDVML